MLAGVAWKQELLTTASINSSPIFYQEKPQKRHYQPWGGEGGWRSCLREGSVPSAPALDDKGRHPCYCVELRRVPPAPGRPFGVPDEPGSGSLG